MRTTSSLTFLIHAMLWLTIGFVGSSIIGFETTLSAEAVVPSAPSRLNGINPASSSGSMTPNQELQAVQSMEDTLFGVRYDEEPLDVRLNRLETTVFGQVQTGQTSNTIANNLDSRIEHLQKSLSPKALGPLSAPSNREASTDKNSTGSNNPSKRSASGSPDGGPEMGGSHPPTDVAHQTIKPTPGETDYPTVSQMENKLFGRTYVQEDITTRLDRLEKQVFHAPQTGELADRVDNLKLIVFKDDPPPVSGPYNGYAQDSQSGAGAYPPSAGSLNGGNGQNRMAYAPGGYAPYASGAPYGNTAPYGNSAQSNAAVTPDMISAIAVVEKQVLGHQYTSDTFTARLDRLETKLFKSTSPDMSPQDRLQRIMAVATAGGGPTTTQTKVKTTLQILLPIILTLLPLVLL